jgi:hypothetical protein
MHWPQAGELTAKPMSFSMSGFAASVEVVPSLKHGDVAAADGSARARALV